MRKIGTSAPPTVIYVELYPANRTDADIIARPEEGPGGQATPRRSEKQRQFQQLEKQLGMQ